MNIKELDVVELLDGRICTILLLPDRPSIKGYLVEGDPPAGYVPDDGGYDNEDEAIYVVQPDEIKNVVYSA
jgi:hypothetical protein